MRKKSVFWWWIILGVVLAAGVQLWVLWAQKRLSFWPDAQRRSLEGAERAGFSELEISTTDGVSLVAWWRPPDQEKATVLFFGGNAGSIADRRFFLEMLAGRGYGILGVNYRGYGGSTGSPSEKGIYTDGLSAFDFLVGKRSIAPRTVVVFGQSIGGTVATQVALKRQVTGIVLESGFTSAQAMARRVVPFLPLWLLMTYHFDNLDRVRHIECPKLFVHGQKDETVPFPQGKALFDNAREPKRFYPIAGASHNDVVEVGGKAYLDFLQEFIDSCAGGGLSGEK